MKKQFLSIKEHRTYLKTLHSLPREHSPLWLIDETLGRDEGLLEDFFLHEYFHEGGQSEEDDIDIDELARLAIAPDGVSPFKNYLFGWEMESWSGLPPKGVKLFIGNATKWSGGELQQLGGYRCFSIAKKSFNAFPDVVDTLALLDSGAFSLTKEGKRARFDTILDTQLFWEYVVANHVLNLPEWKVHALSSYDWLIWEKHPTQLALGSEEKVNQTVAAALYLASQRSHLKGRHLILVCQGSIPQQYQDCVERVLTVAESDDWIGLGGLAKLGLRKSNLPVFFEILHRIIPLIANSPVRHIHVFGCLYDRAIAPALFLCDRYGIELSVDSTRPIRDALTSDKDRAGAREDYWRDNCNWWDDYMQSMSWSPHYEEPPRLS